MSISRLCLGLAFVAVWSIPARAADLTEIDRTIRKEPTYQGKPKYCLLVFGAEAQARFWLVLDGETLYVDLNANGNLTQAGESFQGKREDEALRFKISNLTEPDGETIHTGLHLLQREDGSVSIRVRVENGWTWSAGTNAIDRLKFAERPSDAPIIHFNGPRTFGMLEPKTLERDIERNLIWSNYLSIGTSGFGSGTFASLDSNQIPKPQRRLKAEIRYPNQKEGGKPIPVKEEFKFSSRGSNFSFGPVRVPDETGNGKAKLTFSLPDWPEGKVAPATFEAQIVGDQPSLSKK